MTITNPFSAQIDSIKFISDDNTEDENFDIEIYKSNIFCQFERIELEESVNNVFPTGTLLVRDTGDIVSYIAKKGFKKFQITLNSGSEKFTWYITSVTYVNNMASETDQAFVAIYFTNKLFYESQNVSAYSERYELDSDGNIVEGSDTPIWLDPYPFVSTAEHIIHTYGKKRIFSAPEFVPGNPDEQPDPNKGCGVNTFIYNSQPVTNYVMFRHRISDGMRREQFQTNIITYLNYIFTYATNSDADPFYMFWTDFTNCLNYKFFDLRKDLETTEFKFDLDDTDTKKIQAYAIYDSNDMDRMFEIDGQEVDCKKIHVLVTNPAYSLMSKNYYYLRSCPMFMEDTSQTLTGGTFSDPYHLMAPFLSESSNTTLTTVTNYTINDSPGITYALRTSSLKDANLVFLPDKGYFGYLKDFDGTRLNVNVVDAVASYNNIDNHVESTPLALRDSFDPEFGQPPLYPYNDNMYMWQYPYDLTSNHPNRQKIQVQEQNPENPDDPQDVITVDKLSSLDFWKEIRDILIPTDSSEGGSDISDFAIFAILKEVSMNKVLKAKYDAMKIQNHYDTERKDFLIKTETENFITNVLCCIGKDITPKEDWFFAQITGYVQDNRKILGTGAQESQVLVDKLNNAWLYSWKQLQPGPIISGLSGGNTGSTASIGIHASNHSMFHGWTTSPCIGSTGSPTEADVDNLILGRGFTGIETWAINLNERLNGLEPASYGMLNYRGPGYSTDNLDEIGSFSVKPVGFTGTVYSNEKLGGAKHIVKMYQISINDLRDMGLCVPAPNLGNEYVYYFIVENAVDGACNV